MSKPLLLLSVPALIFMVGCENTSPEYLGILNQAENSPDPQKQIQAIHDLVKYHWNQDSALNTVTRISNGTLNQSVKSAAQMAVTAIKALQKKDSDDTTTAIILMS